MLVDENTNSWDPVVDGRRGGATPQQHRTSRQRKMSLINTSGPTRPARIVFGKKAGVHSAQTGRHGFNQKQTKIYFRFYYHFFKFHTNWSSRPTSFKYENYIHYRTQHELINCIYTKTYGNIF